MSRSDYDDDASGWSLICWRGAVKSAIRGKRGQAFLVEMLASLDALPQRMLIANDLERGGEVCAIGAVGKARGIDMTLLDPEDSSTVASVFGISEALAREIVFENDEAQWRIETPEQRFARMRTWILKQLHKDETK